MEFTRSEKNHYIEYTTKYGSVVFGLEALNESDLKKEFSELHFFKIHQIHSDKIVPAGELQEKADAHFVIEWGQAPLIQTADCLPVVIIGKHLVVAIHAGWRGVEQNIIGHSLKQLIDKGMDFSESLAFIGPHIMKKSFEVDLDVASRLKESFYLSGGSPKANITFFHQNPKKQYVDLEAIARQQVLQQLPSLIIESTKIDTFTDTRFHSYRRNKTKGRQWSFGFLKRKC